MSAGGKRSNEAEALTSCRAETRQCQQGRKRVAKQRHSHAEEQRTSNISRGQKRATKQRHSLPGKQRPDNVSREETEQLSADTHSLESRDQAISAEEKQGNQVEALTS